MPVCTAKECEGTVSNALYIHVHIDKPYLELSNFSVLILYVLYINCNLYCIHTLFIPVTAGLHACAS